MLLNCHFPSPSIRTEVTHCVYSMYMETLEGSFSFSYTPQAALHFLHTSLAGILSLSPLQSLGNWTVFMWREKEKEKERESRGRRAKLREETEGQRERKKGKEMSAMLLLHFKTSFLLLVCKARSLFSCHEQRGLKEWFIIRERRCQGLCILLVLVYPLFTPAASVHSSPFPELCHFSGACCKKCHRPCYPNEMRLYPTTNGGMQNGSSIGIYTVQYTLHTHFCTFGTDLYAQSMLINRISASELSQKFIQSALLVG